MHVRFKETSLKDPLFMVGSGLAVIFVAISLLGPLLAPFDPWDMSFAPISPPSETHYLGVNDGGQDIFSELLYAVRNTVLFGFISAFAALGIGVILGASAGWFGGFVDMIVMRIADVLLAVPAIMILIFAAALFRPTPLTLALILAGFMWPTISKGIRAQTLSLRESLHIRAAVQMGGGGVYIVRRHLIPEMFPLYLIGLAAKAKTAMFMEASLGFLGLLDPSRKSLGRMINYALNFYYMDVWWNWLMPPILCLSFLIVSVTFLAISLEKVLDPRLRAALSGRTP